MAEPTAPANPAVSIVVPVKDEADNVEPLVEEIAAAMEGRWSFEVVYVNDGSTDTTETELARLMAVLVAVPDALKLHIAHSADSNAFHGNEAPGLASEGKARFPLCTDQRTVRPEGRS